MLVVFSFSCRKAESLIPIDILPGNTHHEQFFDLRNVNDPEIVRLAADLRKIDSANNFLNNFIKKNGLPRWDMVDYRVKQVNVGGITLNDTNSPSDSSNSGLFFLPFQHPENGQVMGYLGAFKLGNGNYSYQMYNRDSLLAVIPAKGKAFKEITSLLAVIGHFERKINGKKTIPLPIGKDVKISNSKLGFKENASNNGLGITLNSEGCFVIIDVYVEYEITYNTSYTEEVIGVFGFYDQYIVEIPCSPDSGGSTDVGENNNDGNSNWPGWSNNGTGQTGNNENESSGGGNNSSSGGPNTEDEYDPWWSDGGGGDFRIIDNQVVTPADYPGKTLGFSWLWWESVIITPEERAIFDKIYEDDPFQEPDLGEPCKGSNRMGSVMRAGNVEHWMIQYYYLGKNPQAKREYQIPKAGANGGFGYADLVNLATLELFEIKKKELSEIILGRDQVNRYIQFAIPQCSLYLQKGYNFTDVVLPYPGKPNMNLKASLYENGIITYEEVSKIQFPLPVSIPSTVIERLKKLIDDMGKYPQLQEQIIKEFFGRPENQGILTFIKVTAFTVGVTIFVATFWEDIVTFGGGTWNDLASIAAAGKLINFAIAK